MAWSLIQDAFPLIKILLSLIISYVQLIGLMATVLLIKLVVLTAPAMVEALVKKVMRELLAIFTLLLEVVKIIEEEFSFSSD